MRVAQVTAQPLARPFGHRLDADLDTTATTFGALLQPLGPHGETAIVHVPDGKGQRGQRLQVVLGEELLAVAEVHRTLQLAEFRQRGEVDEFRGLVVLSRRVPDVAQQLGLPVRYSSCLAPWPSRNRTPLRSRRFGDRFPSPISDPSTTWNCCSPSRCVSAASTRSPAMMSPASVQPPGVRTRWFGVAANCDLPLPPDFSTVNCRK